MKPKPITAYNQKALIEVNESFKFYENQRGKTEMNVLFSYESFDEKMNDLSNLLDAISVISYQGDKQDSGLCGGLADIAKKLIPYEEAYFLNNLLLKIKPDSENEFINLETIKK